MYTDDTLVDMPLDVLIELFRKSSESLVVSKINKEDPETITLYQEILEQVKKAIIEKRDSEHSHQ